MTLLSREDDFNESERTRHSAQMRILRYAEEIGSAVKACRYFGVGNTKVDRTRTTITKGELKRCLQSIGMACFVKYIALFGDETISNIGRSIFLALQASGCGDVRVLHKPRLLSDNGSSYISAELADWLGDKGMDHTRGAPMHPQTQGKIASRHLQRQMPVGQRRRWHQTLKNQILLENYYLLGDLEKKIADFISYYSHVRYHESIANLTPTDVYFGGAQTIFKTRERIKHQTLKSDACITASKPLKMKPKMRQILRSIRQQEVHIYLTTDKSSEDTKKCSTNRMQ